MMMMMMALAWDGSGLYPAVVTVKYYDGVVRLSKLVHTIHQPTDLHTHSTAQHSTAHTAFAKHSTAHKAHNREIDDIVRDDAAQKKLCDRALMSHSPARP
jgi:hypothetical protein